MKIILQFIWIYIKLEIKFLFLLIYLNQHHFNHSISYLIILLQIFSQIIDLDCLQNIKLEQNLFSLLIRLLLETLQSSYSKL